MCSLGTLKPSSTKLQSQVIQSSSSSSNTDMCEHNSDMTSNTELEGADALLMQRSTLNNMEVAQSVSQLQEHSVCHSAQLLKCKLCAK
jgi:hypothetical protein